MARSWLHAAALAGAAAMAACTHGPPAAPVLRLDRPIALLGEVHDNAAAHALRLQAFDALLSRGARPALLMEQFDRTEQASLDAARQRMPAPSAAELVAAVHPAPGGSGWNWAFYEPFIERALRFGLPIVAANIGRDEARQVMREGLAAHGFEARVPEDIMAGIAAAIEASHCGQVDNALARRMALAQVARDQQMARAVSAHAMRGAVLLAGNGHVRKDLGVPRWVDSATRGRMQSIGVLEDGDPADVFDARVFVPAQPRPNPCASMPAPGRSSE